MRYQEKKADSTFDESVNKSVLKVLMENCEIQVVVEHEALQSKRGNEISQIDYRVTSSQADPFALGG